jgi:hypothetical protein
MRFPISKNSEHEVTWETNFFEYLWEKLEIYDLTLTDLVEDYIDSLLNEFHATLVISNSIEYIEFESDHYAILFLLKFS